MIHHRSVSANALLIGPNDAELNGIKYNFCYGEHLLLLIYTIRPWPSCEFPLKLSSTVDNIIRRIQHHGVNKLGRQIMLKFMLETAGCL